MSVSDADGCIVHVNDEFVRRSKYTRDELLGQNHRILNSSHHSKEFWDEAYRKLAKGKLWRSPVKNRAKDGSLYWVDALIVPLKGKNGRTKGYLSIQTDITKAVTVHIELQERAALLQEIVESFPGGIAVFDKEQRLILCNEKQKQLMEYPDEPFANGRLTREQLHRFVPSAGNIALERSKGRSDRGSRRSERVSRASTKYSDQTALTSRRAARRSVTAASSPPP